MVDLVPETEASDIEALLWWLFDRGRPEEMSIAAIAESLGWTSTKAAAVLRDLANNGLITIAMRFGYPSDRISLRIAAFVGDFGDTNWPAN